MEEENILTKLEELMKRLEKIEEINKEQQLLTDKLTKDLEKESEVTKMNPWKNKY